MTDGSTKLGAPGFIKLRFFRCLIAALFTAGITTALVNVFTLAVPEVQPTLFILLLAVGFVAAQIQERMHRFKDQS